jgi:acetyl-CoA acetyltransferase
MLDAHINYDDVDQGVACYCYGDSTCGQRVFYQFGMTGIPVYNVNNNCSTGSTGLYMGRNMIAHGAADCVLVVGFEKMFPGSLQAFFQDRTNPTATTNLMLKETRGVTKAPGAAQLFGNAGREHMEKYTPLPSPHITNEILTQPGTAPSSRTLRKSPASTTRTARITPTRSSRTSTRWTRSSTAP